ncbi:beta-1,2-xylosyltransferase XYXT1-like isoform X2 [Malus sylvestris]|uniref:beta-1,2-xylosyltransferase XYXT1-like isoform X2 n=1 Tax=Malus domestica TaxID=3750 RepID=UPI0004988B84|nr:beta-1,2-xylosyltransferase XYXT1-like isoform X2 [Malus domestica]XP_050150276.1 beta-1,2-xylosyltransferase XYXT1-like isoform X2 [Malus sylvestris]
MAVMYDSILARSFSKHEQKKLRYGAFVCCLLIALCFCTLLKPNLNPLPALKLERSVGVKQKILALWETNSTQQVIKNVLEFPEIKTEEFENLSDQVLADSADLQQNASILTSPIESSMSVVVEVVEENLEPLCKTEEPRTEYCEIINRDVRVDANSSSVFVASSSQIWNRSWTIRPYARKEDKTALGSTRAWSVKPVQTGAQLNIPQCTRDHSVPAILFSTGGYVGNHFHEFTDVVIPLFITSRKYDGEVQFLVSDMKPWWIAKYQAILKGLSKYEIIDIDKEDAVHCFPSVTVGLKRHEKELSIDPSKHSYSMKDFREFLRNRYSLKRASAIRIRENRQRKRPRLLIIPRKRTRSFTNTGEITKMARRLGFKVIVAEADMNLSKFAEVVNSCDVLVGVHGAGLTNLVFLPENAILIQILPVGRFQWLATNYFGKPSEGMNLKYLEYEISNEESTLTQQYPLDHPVFTDPSSIGKQGWLAFYSLYLQKQNVHLNVQRFRPTLLKALELLHQ